MKIKASLLALGVISFAGVLTAPSASAKEVDHKQQKPIIVTVKAGDTLDAIAKKYRTSYPRLFNANKQISDPNTIDVGDKIRIPGKKEKLKDRFSAYEAAATAPAAATSTYTTHQYSSRPVSSSSYYVGNGMWCTDYVHSRRADVPIYGNAGYNWISAAQADGKSTGSVPRPGAIAVMSGHVAYVESVNSDGTYVVSEMGWNYQAGNYNKRTVSPGTFGAFIY